MTDAGGTGDRICGGDIEVTAGAGSARNFIDAHIAATYAGGTGGRGCGVIEVPIAAGIAGASITALIATTDAWRTLNGIVIVSDLALTAHA